MVDAGPNPVERCRPFSVGDAMIFVAAAAVGMAQPLGRLRLQSLWSALRTLPFGTLSGWSGWWVYITRTSWRNTEEILAITISIVGEFLRPVTVAFLVARLRRPRPALGRVWWQPGMLANEAILLTFGLLALVDMYQPKGYLTFWRIFIVAPLPLGWSALALSGRWRREPGWIDRLGVAIGAGSCLEFLAVYWLVVSRS